MKALRLLCFRRSFAVNRCSFSKSSSSSEKYDLVVIGGGSGGLACAKEAADHGKKVALLDYVEPTLFGNKWGLGGTCVNVGCIPKKLMHQAGLLGHYIEDSSKFGWIISQKPTHSWQTLVDAIHSYLKSLNWGYRVQLQEKKVVYLNAIGSFVDKHTVKANLTSGKEKLLSAENVVIAVGGRPKYPKTPGAELGITSDDLFNLQHPPKKTLVVGASYSVRSGSRSRSRSRSGSPIPIPSSGSGLGVSGLLGIDFSSFVLKQCTLFHICVPKVCNKVQLTKINSTAIETVNKFVTNTNNSPNKVKNLKNFDHVKCKNVIFSYAIPIPIPVPIPTGIEVIPIPIPIPRKGNPDRTLLVDVALECAGFLRSLNFEVDLSIRSIPLRGFDQQMASLIVENMQHFGTKIYNRCVVNSVEKSDGNKLRVNFASEKSETFSDVYDTVLWAIGREPVLNSLELTNAKISVDNTSGKIIVDDHDRTNVSNVFAIGDVQHGNLELTPVAIMAGKMLARRLCGLSSELMDYKNVPTTIFTPIEYSYVGLAEERAISTFGKNNIEVYHAFFQPLEYAVPNRKTEKCYVKAICVKSESSRIVGIHFLGPNAGEVIQGFAVAIKCGVTLDKLQQTVGIHPTCAEEIVKLNITKSSGKDPTVTGC